MSSLKNIAEKSLENVIKPKKSLYLSKTRKSKAPSATPKTYLISYKIRLLDKDQKPLEISISKHATGQALFNKVCDELGNIIERDYFGLRYMDKNNQRQWLDLSRNVKKQLTGARSTALSFRIKHYPGNPIADLHQEISQYLLYLQIRRDLVQGRLQCPLKELYTIGALILQSEYGDAPSDDDSSELSESLVSEEECKAYFKNFKIVLNHTKEIESEIINQHKIYRGLTAKDAEIEVIKRAAKLPTYGVDPFPVKIITKAKSSTGRGHSASTQTAATVNANSLQASSHQDALSNKTTPSRSPRPVYLGLRHTGLTTYVGVQLSEHFEWDSIDRLACNGKDFIVHLKPATESEKSEGVLEQATSTTEEIKNGAKRKKTAKVNKKPGKARVVTFRCDTNAAALALWRWTVDRQSFFTLRQASEAKITKTTNSFFRRSHSYRFIGKSQVELKSIANSSESFPQISFVRVSSLRRSRGQEGEAGSVADRATFPARIRAPKPGLFSIGDVAKRPAIWTTAEPVTASSETGHEHGVVNTANDLRAGEAIPSKKDSEVPHPVDPVPISVTAAESYCSQVGGATAQLRHRPIDHTRPTVRDSECLRAVNEIDNAINSIQNANRHQKPTFISSAPPNGEVALHEFIPISGSYLCSGRALIHAMKAIAILGVIFFAVIIAALETSPVVLGSGRQAGFWTDLVMHLQKQPLVASFNEYIYLPLRYFFIGRGR